MNIRYNLLTFSCLYDIAISEAEGKRMARYDSLRKADAGMVAAYHEAHPELSHKEIGEKFGISRQRVSQILREAKQDKALAIAR